MPGRAAATVAASAEDFCHQRAKSRKEQKFFGSFFQKKNCFLKTLVELWGIEPQTSSLRTTRSTN